MAPPDMPLLADAAALLPIAERIEADALASFAAAASPETAAACGLTLHVRHGVVGCFAARVDVLALNRIVGFSGAPPAGADLEAWNREARALGVSRFFVQVPPLDGDTTSADAMAPSGGRFYNRWVRLARRVAEPVAELRPTTYRIEQLDGADRVSAGAYAAVLASAFGFPPLVQPWIADSIGRPGWRHYAARDGAPIVATAAMYLAGRLAWFGFAATHPDARGRGAQSALIARRLADAHAAGAEWAIVETAEETADRRAPSFHNLRALGFDDVYRRANYLFDLREAVAQGA